MSNVILLFVFALLSGLLPCTAQEAAYLNSTNYGSGLEKFAPFHSSYRQESVNYFKRWNSYSSNSKKLSYAKATLIQGDGKSHYIRPIHIAPGAFSKQRAKACKCVSAIDGKLACRKKNDMSNQHLGSVSK